MNSVSFMYLLLAVVAIVNVVSALLWIRLLMLVRAADRILSFTTASMYARYLFVLGNPKRDPVIRKVIGSAQYQTVQFLASFVKDLPVNVVPFLV
jgi:hypothetical protein